MTTPIARLSSVHRPLLSVIVPTFNVVGWVEELLLSLQSQTFRDWEAIVVDDHSQDGTWDVLKQFASNEPRFRIYQNPDRGGAQARNFGISLARGEYLTFADSDDLVPSGSYKAFINAFKDPQIDLIIGDYLTTNAVNAWKRSREIEFLSRNNSQIDLDLHTDILRDRVCWNKCVRTSFWKENGIQFSDARRANDIYAVTLALISAKKISIIQDVTYIYRKRIGPGSMSNQTHAIDSAYDYFREELKCLHAVQGTLSVPALQYYVRQRLDLDIFDHLVRIGPALTNANLEQLGQYQRIVQVVSVFLGHLPSDELELLPEGKQLLYELLPTIAFPDVLLSLFHTSEPTSRVAELRDERYLETFDAIHAIGSNLNKRFLANLFRTRYLSPVAEEWDSMDQHEQSITLESLTRFQRRFVPRARLSSTELAFIRPFKELSTEQRSALASVLSQHPPRFTLKVSGRQLTAILNRNQSHLSSEILPVLTLGKKVIRPRRWRAKGDEVWFVFVPPLRKRAWQISTQGSYAGFEIIEPAKLTQTSTNSASTCLRIEPTHNGYHASVRRVECPVVLFFRRIWPAIGQRIRRAKSRVARYL